MSLLKPLIPMVNQHASRSIKSPLKPKPHQASNTQETLTQSQPSWEEINPPLKANQASKSNQINQSPAATCQKLPMTCSSNQHQSNGWTIKTSNQWLSRKRIA
jgi:hypothetical protein